MMLAPAVRQTIVVAIVLVAWHPAPAGADDFADLVWPVLHERCHACHGADVQEADLRLDTAAAILSAGQRSIYVAGQSGASELIRRVTAADPDERMPPQGPPLTADEVAGLTRWIDAGAPWPENFASPPPADEQPHWAWLAPEVVAVPEPRGRARVQSPVDGFILARLEAAGRELAPPAEKRVLLRRLTFDLTGLPPTPEETAAFLADDAPEAVAAVVERLLASPRYGERWGRHWMDVVRYADTAGDNADYPIPEARLYRDYIIRSFNADKPYDQFVEEQLAGDLLAAQGPPEKYAERVVATGFLALSRRYATAPFELMHLTLEDAIDTTGRAFLGLTFRCARCHDHKFDPLTQEDYYGLYGILTSTRFPFAGSEEFQSKNLPRTGFVPLLPPAQAQPHWDAYQARLAELQAEVDRRRSAIDALAPDAPERKQLSQDLKPVEAELTRLVRRGSPPELEVAYAVAEGTAADQPIQVRGEPQETGPLAPRRAPRFLAGDAPLPIPAGESGRRQFAAWVASPENPLTARVLVNRVWQHHFGQGLVRTSSNFGRLGEPPTHPELLDWLARQFVAENWSVKALHRLILSSATWQQASDPAGSGDPLWGHFPRRRLDAESIRDAWLFLAGRLDLGEPRPHPFPEIGDWHWTQHQPFKELYPSEQRSVYLLRPRIQRHPYLALFDAPDANVSTELRSTSTVPQQALYLMNDPFIVEVAASLAQRIEAHDPDDERRAAYGIELAWARPAETHEIDAAKTYLARFALEAEKTGLPPDATQHEAWTSFAKLLLTANEFFYLD